MNSRVYLLFDRVTCRVLPLSRKGLQYSQLPLKQLRNSGGSVLFSSEGEAWDVVNVESLGFCDRNVVRTVGNFLTRRRRIRLELRTRDLQLPELRKFVKMSVANDMEIWFDKAVSLQQAIDKIDECNSFSQLFDLLGIQSESDCMDVY